MVGIVTELFIKGAQFDLLFVQPADLFPPLLLAIPLYTIFVRLGLADIHIALIISHCTITLPLVTLAIDNG
ncbi:MAG: hypothetical protein ACNYPI_00815 [Arenicellales bacterium WSBS_2016_MAG_OTU3]